MAQDLAMMILMQAQDQVSGVIKNIGDAFGPLGSVLATATNALIGFGQQSVQVATQYDQSQRMIQSLTGATNQQMSQYDAGVKQLASDTGVAATQLSGGLYNMISAGYSGSDAMKMLTLSTKDSVIGMTDATTTSNALTTVMRGFGLSIQQADAVNGMMIRTVTAGKMTMGDYAGAVAKTSSTAVQFHDTMVDMNAVLATLTSNGVKSAAIAGTDYDNLLKVLNGDTDKVAKKSKALNPAFNETSFAAMNVADKVKYLNSMIVDHGHQISEVMGKQQNAEAAFTILANNAKMYGDNLKNLGDAQANANATQDAWAITQQGFQVSMNRVNAAVQNFMISLGTVFLPILSKVMTAVANVVTGITNWIQQSGVLQTVTDALGTAFTAVGTIVQQVWDFISPLFDGLSTQAQSWGSNMMGGFISGVESMIGDLVTMLESVAQEIANFIGFASPSKKGPGRNLMTWGPAMIQSFAQGIVASGSSVQDAVAQVAQIASDGLQGVNGQQAGASAGNGFASGVSSSGVSISSGLQTVSVGHPFGMSASSSGATAKAANPLTTALSTHAASLAATTTKHAAAVAAALTKHQAALAKHAATVAAALKKHQAVLAKHAASVAAATQKHAAALAKHAATAAATAARHQAAMVKHAASVAAALKKHEEVLAREAANQAKRDAKAAAKAAGKSGAGGGTLSGLSSMTNQLQGLQVPNIGKQISSSVQGGIESAKKQFTASVAPIKTIVANLVQQIQPAWDAFTWGIIFVVSTIKTQLIPALLQEWNAIKPLVMGIAELVQYVIKGAAAFAIWMVKSGALVSMWDGLAMYVRIIISIISVLIGVLASALAPVFKQIVDTVKTQLWPALQGLWQALLPLMPLFKDIAMLIGGVLLIAIGLLISILAGLLTGLGALIAGVIRIFGGIVQVISGAITVILGIVAVFQHLMTGRFDLLGNDLKNIWGGIVTMFKGVWNIIAGIVQGFVGMIVGIVGGFITTIISFFSHLYDTLVGHSIIPDLVKAIIQWMQSMVTTVLLAIFNFVNSGIQYFQNFATNIGNFFGNLARSAYTWGANLIGGIVNGISSMVGNVANAAGNIAQTIKNQLGWHSPTKEGPGKDSDEWAPSLVKMMTHDLDNDGVKNMKKSAQNIASAISGVFSNPTAIAATILTSAGVALPNYNAGTGQTIADQQPVAATSASSSSPLAQNMHIHVHLGDSDGDARQHGQKVAEAVKKELAKYLRGQAITPRYTSGGR